MTKPRLSDLRADQLRILETLAVHNVSLTAAAAELGMDPRTLRAAAERMGKADWLAEKFPPKRGFTGKRYRPDARAYTSSPSNQQTVMMLAATMSWRPNRQTHSR